VSSEIELMVLIGGAKEEAAIQWERSIWLGQGGDHMLHKNATAMFAETLVNTKHSMWLSPESQSYIFIKICSAIFKLLCTERQAR
jgi:hypothetical protein